MVKICYNKCCIIYRKGISSMKIANNWKDYKILDMADGQKLERWGEVILSRPDPQIIWKQKTCPKKWKEINAVYYIHN